MRIPGSRTLTKLTAPLNHRGIVLMYHRVENLDFDPWQLAVSPAHFEEHLRILKKYGKPVKMKTIGKNIKGFAFGKKEIAVTFDDGYADNFTNARPILERYKIPATFFIVSGAINSQEEYWWDELERIALSAAALPERFDLTIQGKKYNWRINPMMREPVAFVEQSMRIPAEHTALTRGQLYFALWQIMSGLTHQAKKIALQQIVQWAGPSLSPRCSHRVMTSEELSSLATSSLFEIGGHTVRHPMLSQLSVVQQEEEIGQGKADLEKRLGRAVTSFAYPHGDFSTETIQITKRVGFRAACSTVQQTVKRNGDPYLLPRFTVLDWDGQTFEQYLQKWLIQKN